MLISAKALGKYFPGAFSVESFYELHGSGGEECYEKKKIFDSDDDGYDGGIHVERMRLRFQFREFRGNGNRGEHRPPQRKAMC